MAVPVRVAVRIPANTVIARVTALIGDRVVSKVEQPERAARGIAVTEETAQAQPQSDEQVYALSVTIPAEDCLLTIRAETSAGESRSTSLHLRWEGLREVPVAAPRLYVLSVGISNYSRQEYTLTYAAKDARDIAATFARQRGRLYRDVTARVLTDGGAGKSAILDGLEWLQHQMTTHDVAVLFLAGHGIVDPSSGRYFFLPHDADPEAIKRTMVSQDDIQTTLRTIAGKTLMFIDSCHSGKVLSAEQNRSLSYLDSLIGEIMGADNGVVVFTASMGRQPSRESPRWGNGAFTKAVIEGIDGHAALVRGRPITVAMLDLYISERVKVLTAGTQTPTTAKPSTLPDFPIALPPQSDAPQPSLLQLVLTSEPSAKHHRPLYRKWWFWTSLGAASAALATGLGVALGRKEELLVVEPMPKVK